MKRKKCFIIVIIAVMLVLISEVLGTKKVVELMQAPQQERQIEFLKKHEKEMTAYVKSQNSKIKTVQYDWESVQVETVGNGTLTGAGKVLTIDGKFNHLSNSSFYLQFELDESSGLPIIEHVTSYNSFRVGGKLYE